MTHPIKLTVTNATFQFGPHRLSVANLDVDTDDATAGGLGTILAMLGATPAQQRRAELPAKAAGRRKGAKP